MDKKDENCISFPLGCFATYSIQSFAIIEYKNHWMICWYFSYFLATPVISLVPCIRGRREEGREGGVTMPVDIVGQTVQSVQRYQTNTNCLEIGTVYYSYANFKGLVPLTYFLPPNTKGNIAKSYHFYVLQNKTAWKTVVHRPLLQRSTVQLAPLSSSPRSIYSIICYLDTTMHLSRHLLLPIVITASV